MEKKKGRKKKLLLVLLAAALIFCAIYALIGRDLIALHRLVRNNPETKEFASHYLTHIGDDDEIDITGEVLKGTIPHFLQWDERWGYKRYGSSMLAVTGCGPTCLSMVVTGLTGDTKWNPYEVSKFSKENGYYSPGTGSSWLLMQEGAEKLGLSYSEVIATEAAIVNRLKEGKPIICSMRKGDFTSSGHFIVLVGLNPDGSVKVHDPNSIKRTEKGWEVSVLLPQIRGMWAYSTG